MSNLQGMYPKSTLFCCSVDTPPGLSVTGSKIEFFSGIPFKLTQKGKIIFELTQDALKHLVEEGVKSTLKKQIAKFPCISSNMSVSSFLDRISRDKLTYPNIVKEMRDGSYFDHNVTKTGWWGCFTDAGGYANMNREIVKRLHNYHIIPYIKIYNTINQIEPQMVDTLRMYSDLSPKKGDHPYVYAYTPMPHEYHGGKRIFFTMMETASLHPVFSGHCNKYSDEVWVPSQSNKEIFTAFGVKKPVRVVPLGIDENIYFTNDDSKRSLDALVGLYGRSPKEGVAKFKFLNMAQWNFRKGFDALIKSFVNAFDASDDVCLVIATQYSSEVVKNDLNQFIPRADNLPQVLLYNHIVPTVEMPAFYRNFDCYVHFSRGEGFSLTQIEAAACGLPVISCLHSGMTEYITHKNSFPIECPDVERCQSRLASLCLFYQDQMLWKLGENQVNQGSEHMRYVVNNYSEALKRADIFLGEVKQKYTWNKTVERISELLKT
jgi:glycosyltransferase involved in cell wall biosynthesis